MLQTGTQRWAVSPLGTFHAIFITINNLFSSCSSLWGTLWGCIYTLEYQLCSKYLTQLLSISILIFPKTGGQRKWHLLLRLRISEFPKSIAWMLLVVKRTEIHTNGFIFFPRPNWQGVHIQTFKIGRRLSPQFSLKQAQCDSCCPTWTILG